MQKHLLLENVAMFSKLINLFIFNKLIDKKKYIKFTEAAKTDKSIQIPSKGLFIIINNSSSPMSIFRNYYCNIEINPNKVVEIEGNNVKFLNCNYDKFVEIFGREIF